MANTGDEPIPGIGPDEEAIDRVEHSKQFTGDREGKGRQHESVTAKHLRAKSTLDTEVATTIEAFKTRLELSQQSQNDTLPLPGDTLRVSHEASVEPEEDTQISSVDEQPSGWRHHARRIISSVSRVRKSSSGDSRGVLTTASVEGYGDAVETAGTRGEEIVQLARETVQILTAQHEALRDSLLEDTDLIEELNGFFIDQQIRPFVERSKERGHITGEQAGAYETLVREQLEENLRRDTAIERQGRRTHNSNEIRILLAGIENKNTSNRLRELSNLTSFGAMQQTQYDEIVALLVRQGEQTALEQLMTMVDQTEMSPGVKDSLQEVFHTALAQKRNRTFFLQEENLVRWQAIKNDPELVHLFGQEAIEEMDEAALHSIIDELLTNPSREGSPKLGFSLLHLENADAIPFAILNCWREGGYNFDYPFLHDAAGSYNFDFPDEPLPTISNDTPIYKYIAALPEAEVAKLPQLAVPGIPEVIEVVRGNPENFLEKTQFEAFVRTYASEYGLRLGKARDEIVDGGWDPEATSTRIVTLLERMPLFDRDVTSEQKRAVANPIAQIVQQRVEAAAVDWLTHGDTRKQAFAVGIFGSRELTLGDEGYQAIESFLGESENVSLQKEMVDRILFRTDDSDAMQAVLRAYSHLDPEVQAVLRGEATDVVRQLLRQGERRIDAATLATLGAILDRDVTDVEKIIDFLQNNDSLLVTFNHREIDAYSKLVNSEALLTTVQELKAYGYYFDVDHLSVLEDVAANRESIVAKIREIRTVAPDYEYKFHFERIEETNEDMYITDPYDVFMYKNGEKSVDKLHKMYEALGEVPREFSDAFLRYAWKRNTEGQVDTADITAEQYQAFHRNIAFLTGTRGTPLSPAVDREVGGLIMHMHSKIASKLLMQAAVMDIAIADGQAKGSETLTITQDNWQQLLHLYLRSQDGLEYLQEGRYSSGAAEKIKGLFTDQKVKDFCLQQIKAEWLSYLDGEVIDAVPFSLQAISRMIEYTGGAGPLSQLESLQKFIHGVDKAFSTPNLSNETKRAILEGLRDTEARFTREKWSNEARTDFYDISTDILSADPELFSEYFTIFPQLNPAELKRFAKEFYPFYRAKLALLEKPGKVHDLEDIVALRADIRDFSYLLGSEDTAFDLKRAQLSEEIKTLFKDRFGITQIPEELTQDNIRSLNDISLYLANLNDRNPDRETMLGFYLALKLNGQWDAFRRGEVIDPTTYLVPGKSALIADLLRRRQELSPLTPDNLGITQEDMPEFLRLLQQETQNIVIGNIETIDVKLSNIILNLRTIVDLDLYPEPLDKKRMELLLRWGNKKIGSVVARMYQQQTQPSKTFTFTADDEQIRRQVIQIMEETEGIDATDPKSLKEHFQDGMKPLATGVNLLNFVDESDAQSEIGILQDRLSPNPDVIAIFRRLGENFKPTSGALALSQDLTYLDTLVVKREDELQTGEKELLTEYIGSIREQVIKLEEIYGKIAQKFTAMRQGSKSTGNPLLEAKFADIDRVIHAQASQQTVTSTITEDINVIIENMRECLSCTRQGANNDTNLTFGDTNKFYVYSQTETQQNGSISDQVVFLEPITHEDGTEEMAFVFDRIYGTNTPTILQNQVETVLKKARAIKGRFPNVKLSLFVTSAAIQTGGSSLDMFLKSLQDSDTRAIRESATVNVAASAFADHYVEFGGSVRVSGERSVAGITIAI